MTNAKAGLQTTTNILALAQSMRKKLNLPSSGQSPFVIRLAGSKEELVAALGLLHDVYVSESYMEPTQSRLRISAYNALPSTSTAIALHEGKVIGTVSIIQDSPLGLPIDKVIPVNHLRASGHRLAEISGLAVHPDFRGFHGEVLYRLVKFIITYCQRFHGDDILVISVNPKHGSLYRDILLFDPINDVPVEYEFVKGAPALGKYLRLERFDERLLQTYGATPSPENLREYLRAADRSILFPQRETFRAFDTLLSPENLAHLLGFFRTDGILGAAESAVLRSWFTLPGYRNLFPGESSPVDPSAKPFRPRASQRFPFRSAATLFEPRSGQTIALRVDDIGTDGIGGWMAPAAEASTYKAVVPVSSTRAVSLDIEPVYTTQSGKTGFRVTQAKGDWEKMNRILTDILTNGIEQAVGSAAPKDKKAS